MWSIARVRGFMEEDGMRGERTWFWEEERMERQSV